MAYQQITYTVAERIATITLNRPEQLNAWTDVMAQEVYAGRARGRSRIRTCMSWC